MTDNVTPILPPTLKVVRSGSLQSLENVLKQQKDLGLQLVSEEALYELRKAYERRY